jgi:inner membrane protein
MLVFAHLGLTLAAAKFTERFGLHPAFLFVAVGSMLPDIIDKPLGYLIYGSMANGRIFAHTLLFLFVLATIAAILRSRALGSLSFGVLAHLVLDSIWTTPVILLWPLLGDFPIKPNLSVLGYFEMLMRGLENPEILIPEVLGFLYLAHFVLLGWPEKLSAAKRIARRP